MDGVLNTFGIDWRLIIIQIFNFSLLMAILWYFLYTPVLKILKERQQKIVKGIEDAERAGKMKDEAMTERSSILTEAQLQATSIVSQSKVTGTEKSAQIIHDAEVKADMLVKNAEAKGAELLERSKKESEAEVAKMAVLAAERILSTK